jgi:hypothetical protein
MSGIKINDLPQTIADAVELCRNIDIHYLWVDALCILQDHGSAEWNEEASIMDKVYGFASFTLAISSSADMSEGFLDVQSESPYMSDSNVTMAHHMLQPAAKNIQQARYKSPLDSRGWTFQEERLSPRILHWTAHGVFWTCLSGSCSSSHSEFTFNKPGEKSPFFENFDEPFYQENEEGLGKFTHIDSVWSRVIETYSTREFQRMNDRLPALSGLARKYAMRNNTGETKLRYLAGHWMDSFHSSLLWVIANGFSTPFKTNPANRLPIAPSWSWVSVPSVAGVRFPRRHGRSRLNFVEDGISRMGVDEFGAIRMPVRLTVRSRLRPLLQGERQVEWPKHELEDDCGQPIFLDMEDRVYALDHKRARILVSYDASHPVVIQTDYGLPTRLEDCYCMQVNDNGVLLLEKLSGEDTYSRIGCAPWHEDSEMFANYEVAMVELI